MLLPVHVAALEIKRFIVTRGELAFSIALPIVLFVLMQGVASGGSFSGTAHIADLDDGELSNRLIQVVDEVDGIDTQLYSESELDDALDRSAVLTGFVIPEGFTEAIRAGETTSIELRQRGSGGDEGQIVAQIVEGIARGLTAEFEVRALAQEIVEGSGVPDEQINQIVADLVAQAGGTGGAVDVIGGGEIDDGFADRIMPGILVMFLLFSVTLSAQTIVEERAKGTLERLLTTRLSVTGLFAGKFLAGIGRAMVQVIVLLSLGFAVLRPAGIEAFAQALVFCLIIGAAVSGIGMLVASISRTRDQANWAAVVITLAMTVFGGTFFEVRDTGALNTLSQFTINRYAIDGLNLIISDGGALTGQGFNMLVLVGVAVVTLIIGRLLFRATEGAR